jgi:hypothetical protein
MPFPVVFVQQGRSLLTAGSFNIMNVWTRRPAHPAMSGTRSRVSTEGRWDKCPHQAGCTLQRSTSGLSNGMYCVLRCWGRMPDSVVARRRRYIKQQIGRAMAQAVSHRHLTTEDGVRARFSLCDICWDKVALGQVFVRVLRFSPVNIIPPPWLHTHISPPLTWGMNNSLVGGRSSET